MATRKPKKASKKIAKKPAKRSGPRRSNSKGADQFGVDPTWPPQDGEPAPGRDD